MTTPLALAQVGPPLVVLALLLGALELILRRTTWLASLEAPLGRRLASLDGLRALLAYGVVVCHIGTFYEVYQGVAWGPHPNPYYRQAGAGSVRLFFMITGFLFWSKAIQGGGRLDAIRLYRNRFFRIMPLYAALVATLALVALASRSFRYVDSPGRVVWEVSLLLCPGWHPWGEIDGFNFTPYLRSVWTLKWEIVFCALLPLIAFGARSLAAFAGLAAGLVALTLLGHRANPDLPDLSITLNFLAGMLVAHLKASWTPPFDTKGRGASLAVAAILVLAPLVIASVSPYAGNVLYAILFALVVYGNDLFGLLAARSARVLGEISYSVYLLHLLVLVPFYGALDRATPLAGMPFATFWLASSAAVAAIVLLSILTFRSIERWGIARGRSASQPGT